MIATSTLNPRVRGTNRKWKIATWQTGCGRAPRPVMFPPFCAERCRHAAVALSPIAYTVRVVDQRRFFCVHSTAGDIRHKLAAAGTPSWLEDLLPSPSHLGELPGILLVLQTPLSLSSVGTCVMFASPGAFGAKRPLFSLRCPPGHVAVRVLGQAWGSRRSAF